ncbi:MAG: hypothetical protein KAI15_11595, partial [Gammaproteobacteria bacterium]|nr:hypothetical protein [Gammaproteobacteria bacterium]
RHPSTRDALGRMERRRVDDRISVFKVPRKPRFYWSGMGNGRRCEGKGECDEGGEGTQSGVVRVDIA